METAEAQLLGKEDAESLSGEQSMLLNDLIHRKLFPHLWEIQRTATARIDQLMMQLLQKDPAPDKKINPLTGRSI